MPKVVIIGQSPAVVSVIRSLRSGGGEWDITLISTDGQLPYDRELFPRLINRRLKEKDLFCAPEDFYKENKVTLILDKELSRINVNRRKIFLADRIQVDYDLLVIADVPQVRLPEIKGFRRQGVFHLARLDALRRLVRHLPFVETAMVVPSSMRGIETALALKEAGKEVIVVSSEDRILPREFSGEAAEKLLSLLDKAGVRVVTNNSIDDILGEGEVQAVRFKAGKVVACEMLLLEEAAPDLRFLAEGELVLKERLCVHSSMRTNIDTVYAIDAVMQLSDPEFIGTYSLGTSSVIRQGECAARSISGIEDHFIPDTLKADSQLGSVSSIGSLVC